MKEPEWQFVPSGSTLETDPDVKYDPDLHDTLGDEDSVAQEAFTGQAHTPRKIMWR